MNLIYCLVEQRNRIDLKWRVGVGIICSNIEEAEDLIKNYKKKCFDICEYRLRRCKQTDFHQYPSLLILRSPSLEK